MKQLLRLLQTADNRRQGPSNAMPLPAVAIPTRTGMSFSLHTGPCLKPTPPVLPGLSPPAASRTRTATHWRWLMAPWRLACLRWVLHPHFVAAGPCCMCLGPSGCHAAAQHAQ